MLRSADEVYDAESIKKRAGVIARAIDARVNHSPKEKRFCYQPLAGSEDTYRYDPQTIEDAIRDYNLKDLPI